MWAAADARSAEADAVFSSTRKADTSMPGRAGQRLAEPVDRASRAISIAPTGGLTTAALCGAPRDVWICVQALLDAGRGNPNRPNPERCV